jgi:hypothetical protein
MHSKSFIEKNMAFDAMGPQELKFDADTTCVESKQALSFPLSKDSS